MPVISVQLGQDHAVESDLGGELGGDRHRLLAGHGVQDEQLLVHGHHLVDLVQLPQQRLVDVQAAGGVDDQDVAAVVAGPPLTELDDLGGVLAFAVGVHRHADLTGEGLELVDGGRTVDVRGHQHGLAPLLQ